MGIYSTGQELRDALGAFINATDAADLNRSDALQVRHLWWQKAAADAMASTATSETAILANVYDDLTTGTAIIKKMTITATSGGLTASDADYATVTIKDMLANVAIVTFTTRTTAQTNGTGNWTQYTPLVVPLTASGVLTNMPISAGAPLSITIAKAGSGVVVPACFVKLYLQPA